MSILFFLCLLFNIKAEKINIIKNEKGIKIEVNGKDFIINGMNWDYYPIGTNYNFNLWNQSDEFVKAALDGDMALLKNMGVNTIRVYSGIQQKWIKYIYENYGIYTILNHTFGRYGLTIDGKWIPNTDYSDPKTRAFLIGEVTKLANDYKDTPGLLMFMLGNENNYGLFWEGAETENIPMQDRKSTKKAYSLYSLFNEASLEIKKLDSNHPIAICNGELLFLDIIAKDCKDVDILALNIYRGLSLGDLFEKVKAVYDKPVMFAEFGSDAYNTKNNSEDQQSQAYYDVANWKEVYENVAGLGKTGIAIGGCTFQFSDGWWKYKQNEDLEKHNTTASWANGGYAFDFVPGENNMNEEWFGICAKGETNSRGLYELYPRAAYYALKEVHKLNPYQEGVTLVSLDNYFKNIQVVDAVLKARGDKANLYNPITEKIRISTLRAEMSTFNTGGYLTETPKEKTSNYITYPNKQGFDHMESYYVGIEAKPAENVRANVVFNVLGNVAENPIDAIFYENRGRTTTVTSTDNTTLDISGSERVKAYRAEFNWNTNWFDLNGFYRTGHYHWGYEGDFFGLYPEANYGPNIDIYNGEAPMGMEVGLKKQLDGLKVAYGPELWWGANPSVLVKYNHKFGRFDVAGIFQEDLDKRGSTTSSFAIPLPKNRKATLNVKTNFGFLGVSAGGIWAGQPKVGETFQIQSGDNVYDDKIKNSDTWGGKLKLTASIGAINWYAQGAIMGLVADGGADNTKTYTGWTLKDCGSGNQYNFLSGFTYLIGNFQIAPNFLWQKPIVGPVTSDVVSPGRPRNILEDPFVVRSNRETTAGELLLTFDPTPGTWMYDWDNDMTEDAPFAMNLDFVYRHHPTTQDAAIGILANRTLFAFTGAPMARDVWEVNSRIVSKINSEFGLISKLYIGDGEANGSDNRLIHRYGGDLSMIYKKVKLTSSVKVNDWGPYDYYKDFNLTYPLQIIADLSTTVSKPKWLAIPETKIGIKCTWRSLDKYSPRYCPTKIMNSDGEMVANPDAVGYNNGNEWEIRTYVNINIW